MKTIFLWILVVIAILSMLVGCFSSPSARSSRDIPVVKDFDVSRYLGEWHEIARLPKRYEKGLTHVTATYQLEGDRLQIVNRGIKDGQAKSSTAVGYFAGPSDEGAFRISFFRPFYGDYRIIWLSPEYDQAIVTGNDRSSLWILSRTPKIGQEKLIELLNRAKNWGFDIAMLEFPEWE